MKKNHHYHQIAKKSKNMPNHIYNSTILKTNSFTQYATSAILLWSLGFVLYSGTTDGRLYYKRLSKDFMGDAKAGPPIVHLAIPLLLTGSIASLLYKRGDVFLLGLSSRTKGDVDLKFWNTVLIVLPSISYVSTMIYRHITTIDANETDKIVAKISDSFGMMAEVALAFFLVPVSKGYSPLLVLFGLDPIHATKIHIWSARIASIGVAIHGIGHTLRAVIHPKLTVLGEIWPPSECWSYDSSDDDSCIDCYKYYRNLTGVVSGIALAGILLTSLEYIRRTYYRVFYLSHIALTPIVLGAAIMHHPRIIFYVCPGILYYIATSAPMLSQMAISYFNKGTRLLSVRHISTCSGDCVDMTFEAEEFVAQRRAAQFVRLSVPQVAALDASHPFTVVPSPSDSKSMNIIFRANGTFTKELSRRLMSQSLREHLVFLLDGLYSGPDRLAQALQHDYVVMVAGGIGITPFISLISAIYLHCLGQSSSRFDGKDSLMTRKSVTLHWICRDDGFIDYIISEYLLTMFEQNGSNLDKASRKDLPSFRIVVHHTNAEKNDDQRDYQKPACSDKLKALDHQLQEQAPKKNCDGLEKVICNHAGQKFEPAHFAPSRLSYVDNVPSFAVFSSIAWLGLLIIWKQYQAEILPNKYLVRVRVWGLVMACLVGIIIAAVAELSFAPLRRTFSKWTGSSVDPTATTNDMQLSEDDMTSMSSEEDAKQHKIQNKVSSCLALEHRVGRPDLKELLRYDENAYEDSGIFLCGPTKLLDSAKLAVELTDESSKRSYQIYEESFEL